MSEDQVSPVHASGVSAEARQWGMLAHLTALSGILTAGIGCIVGPLLIWLLKRETSTFVDDQGKEALNFNIAFIIVSVLLYAIGSILLVILIGFLFYLAAFALWVYWLVVTIIATIKANNGIEYRYPLTFRIIK